MTATLLSLVLVVVTGSAPAQPSATVEGRVVDASGAVAIALLALAPVAGTASAEPRAPKTVLTVMWSTEDFPTNPVSDAAIRRAVLSRPDAAVEYFTEYLESDRFEENLASLSLRDYIVQKYRGRKIDVVIAVSDVALQFVLHHRDTLFPDAAVVYSGVTRQDDGVRRAGAGLTGVVSGPGLGETLKLALNLHPSTRQVFVVAEAPDRMLEASMRAELQPLAARAELKYLTQGSLAQLLDAVRAIPPRSLIFYVRFSQEAPGMVLFPHEVARLVAQASPVPVYGIAESYIGTGVVGGAVYSSERIALRLGEMARQILEGTRAQDIPVENAVRTPVFDWRELQRWRISLSQLPAGSDVRFRVRTTWDQYRIYITGTIALLTIQALMIAVLVVQGARRREAEARMVRDLAERRRVESALRDSKERYARATAAGGVGVWDWDLGTNEIYVDPSLKAILGYEDHEIKNHLDDWSRLVYPDDAPSVLERARQYLDGRKPFYEVEHRMLHRDGSIRWFLARGSAVRQDGRPIRIIGSHTDITERKKSEQALHEAQTDLSRLSRLTALGEFAASIAHEVRQPLTAILMNAKTSLRWLGASSPDLTEVRAALYDVVDAGQRADEIIRRNRELFRHHAVQKTAMDINAVIKDVEILAKGRLQGSQVALATSPGANLPAVNGDPVELQQVLLNLVANSIDAMDTVDPRLRLIEISSSLTPERIVRVSVRDTGVGLAGVDMQRMFALSYTTKATGSGVGLSISRAIVEAHGGQLWAEQNPGQGATFSFTVPVHATVAAV